MNFFQNKKFKLVNDIKNGKYSKSLSQEEIVNIFLSYNRDCQNTFISYCYNEIEIVKNQEEFKKFIYALSLIRAKIINNHELLEEERQVFEIVYSHLIIKGINVDEELLHKYCISYIRKCSFSTVDKIFLVSTDLIYVLNKKHKKDYKIQYIKDRNLKNVASIDSHMDDTDDDKVINLNRYIYDTYYKNSKKVPFESVKSMILFIIFMILHEYLRLIQNDYLLEHDDDKTETYEKETFINYIDGNHNRSKFYNKYHHYFRVEEEANIFAINSMFNYFNLYFESDEEFEKRFTNIYYNNMFDKNLDSDSFKEKIDDVFILYSTKYREDYNEYVESLNKKRKRRKGDKLT